MSVFELKTFGGLRLLDGGRVLELPRRRLAVLALLARADADGLPRERIVACLWPDAAPADGRHSLEQVLSSLRGRLGRDLFVGTDPIRLNPGRIASDVGRFLRALAADDREGAATACDGPFLDGFRLPDAWEFEEWAERERAALRERQLANLESLAEVAGASGRVTEAVAWWRRAAEVDPLRSSVAVGLVRALAARGDRIPAIQHARQYEQLIRVQFDLEPDAAIVTVREELERSTGTGFPSPAPRPPKFEVAVADAAARPFDAPAGGPPNEASASPVSTPPGRQRVSGGWVAALLLGFTGLAVGTWLNSADATSRIEATVPSSATVGTRAVAPGGVLRSPEGRPSIAVLPFRNLGEAGERHFADGLTEEITGAIARFEGLRVIGRTSAFVYKDRDADLRRIGEELGADYLVEGSLRRVDDRIRVAASLIDARDGSHVWSDRYDRRLADVFALQGEIAETIAVELRRPLQRSTGRALSIPTRDTLAYDLYLQGRAQLRDRDIQAAIRSLEEAVDRDPSWAPAWAALAQSRAFSVWYPVQPDSTHWARSLEATSDAASRALALDSSSVAAWTALGTVFRERWEWRASEDAYRRALTLDPEDPEALQQYAELLYYVGRLGESWVVAQEALALDPAPVRYSVAGRIAGLDGRYDEAIDLFLEGMRRNGGRSQVGLVYNHYTYATYGGDWTRARIVLLGYIERNFSERLESYRAAWPNVEGPPSYALVELHRDFDCTYSAILAAMLGRADRSSRILLDCLEMPGVVPFGPTYVLWHEHLDPLRDDPVLQEFARRRGLAGFRPVRTADLAD